MLKAITEYLVECFWPGVRAADLAELDARVSALAGDDVRYLGSVLVPEDEVVLCFFAAPSAGAVSALAGRAAVPFARVVRCVSSSRSPARSSR